MKQIIIPYKSGLYSKFLIRLKEAEESVLGSSKKDYLPFPILFEKTCRNFSIKKQEVWEIIFLLRDTGFIEIVKFRGIKLNYVVKND